VWSPKGTTLRVIRCPTLQVSQFLFPGQRSDTFLTDHVYVYVCMYVRMHYICMYVCEEKKDGGPMSPSFFAVFQFHGSWTTPKPNVPFVACLLILQSFDCLPACRVSCNTK
jgi:hypothetical protein